VECPIRAHPYRGPVVFVLSALAIWAGVAVGHFALLPSNLGQWLLVAGAIAATAFTFRYPVQVCSRGQIFFSNVPIFLMAVLLPPPLAALGTLLGMGGGWIIFKGHKADSVNFAGLFGGRWAILAGAASWLCHTGTGSLAERSLVLVGAAALLMIADTLTLPCVVGRLPGDTAVKLITSQFLSSAPLEAAQYLIGILGAAAAMSIAWSPALLIVPVALLYLNGKRSKELQASTGALLENLADAVDLRDPNTGGHSRRVTERVAAVLDRLEITGAEQALILTAARVHDIGKIGIPDSILLKPGRLTDDELLAMQRHAEAGADFLAKHKDFARGVEIVRHHHESWDGSGYPNRLSGQDIPFGSRVIAVADGYDAMISDRPYRAGMPQMRAIAVLQEGRGVQWDPSVVDAFLATLLPKPIVEPAESPAPVTRWQPALLGRAS
jgi:HD-GYP domain-containing protein (c-di-GMP phosphodiesterase class II)